MKPSITRKNLTEGRFLVRDGANVIRYHASEKGAVTVLGVERFATVAEAKRYMGFAH